MRVSLIGAPMDLGAGRRGVDMGPSAIRCAGLGPQLSDLGIEVADLGNLAIAEPETIEAGNPKLKYLDPIRAATSELAEWVAKAAHDSIPVTLGGDHSVSLGSVTGSIEEHGPMGLLWVDAHGDFNTEQTTPSGNIHGMVLAALTGLGDPRLTSIGGFSPKVLPERVAILGARLLDAGERELLHTYGVHVFTMHDIDRRGLTQVVQEALAVIIGDDLPLHVSFDIDVVDPTIAPGVGTPVPGGMTYRDAHLVMELVAETNALRSLDMVEVNPILDHANRTGELAAELICSAFGKRIY
jgi:arginase